MVDQNADMDKPRYLSILNRVNELKIPTKMYTKRRMISLAQESQFQHLILKCSPLTHTDISTFTELMNAGPREGSSGVLIDQVLDPQNLGAILRSAFIYNIQPVIVNAFPRCPLTCAVSRASAGALELLNVYALNTTSQILQQAKQNNYEIVALDCNICYYKMSIPLSALQSSPKRRLFILGSEGSGISVALKEMADYAVYIDPLMRASRKFPGSLIDSLNVSVAAAILFNHINQIKNHAII